MPEEKRKVKAPKKARIRNENQGKKSDQEPKVKVSVLDTVRNKLGILEKTKGFLREVKVEFKKVVWPSRKETTGMTLVVIVLVFITALFLGVIDMSLARLIKVFIR